jgi:hypothetical protein
LLFQTDLPLLYFVIQQEIVQNSHGRVASIGQVHHYTFTTAIMGVVGKDLEAHRNHVQRCPDLMGDVSNELFLVQY